MRVPTKVIRVMRNFAEGLLQNYVLIMINTLLT